MTEAQVLIETLNLAPHPEGGWYRETWRAETADGCRSPGTAILFLLESGQRSHWHKVDATEIWLWHAGASLALSTAPDAPIPATTTRLGPDVFAGQMPQHVIAPHHWQAAHADAGWTLVSCIVVPGFDFAGFTLAAPDWTPG